MRKYIEILKYSIKAKLTFIWDYSFSLFSFAIHVFVFNELWDYILQGKTVVGYTKNELIWYIIIAEFITYTNEKKYKKISSMVKQGDIANMLIKPVDMINYFIAEDASLVIKAGINLVFGLLLGTLLAGPIEVSLSNVILMLVASAIGIFIGVLIQILIGVLAFFTEENNSIYLILQKFCLLVVFTPLEFYPEIVQKIFLFLPTTYYVYAPAKIFTNASINTAFGLLGLEILSAVFLYVLIRVLYKKGVEKINVNGG